MERRSFIRNLSLACVALKVPKVFSAEQKQATLEIAGSKGILWHIQNRPTHIVDFSVGNFSIADFSELADIYRNSK